MLEIVTYLHTHPLWMSVILIFVVMGCVRFMKVRSRHLYQRRMSVRVSDLDPDDMPNLEKKIKVVRIQAIVGFLSLMFFIIFFGIKHFFS